MKPIKSNDFLQTPKYIIEALGGKFDLDPCAGEKTKIGDLNLWNGRGEDGLTINWEGIAYVNPPFSQKELWIKKAIYHNNCILLLPERGSAPWFGSLAKAAGKYFVMGKKINFIGGSSSNNVGTVLFPFGAEAIERIEKSGLPGHFNIVEWFNPRSK